MAYFAQLDEHGIVQQVISIANGVLREPHLAFPETEPFGQEFIRDVLGLPGEYRQTSYNGNFRGRYAGIGYRYDSDRDQFIAPQPFPSWSLDEAGDWQPPSPYPTEGGPFVWDEAAGEWMSVDE